MGIKEAISARHMVRKYTDRPIPADIVAKLNARIEEINKKYGVNIALVTNVELSPIWGIIRLFRAKGVKNYLVLSGPDISNIEELLGYTGIALVLYAQTIGLNSWWIGGTYSKSAARRNCEGTVLNGIIAVGYGASQGVPHKSKTPEEVSRYDGNAPEWFTNGVNATLLAPTALNKQNFMIVGKGNEVSITCDNGRWSNTDLGIVKYHFEVGAGKENFTWK
ncbi:nitroreductase [Prevotella sp. A2931]|uniref:Nitroreductase n=1 Tax=Prevotella illustrans TaxID=2800387 RepID=A0ABS3M2M0_9BACT|nr:MULTISPECIES: nitroreductase family protein [Prevotella]MBO1362384.1 nitroreductase [Prevotella illustrans]PTL25097.1 nitroreductase [Prevotella sp. oral taxon 820]